MAGKISMRTVHAKQLRADDAFSMHNVIFLNFCELIQYITVVLPPFGWGGNIIIHVW